MQEAAALNHHWLVAADGNHAMIVFNVRKGSSAVLHFKIVMSFPPIALINERIPRCHAHQASRALLLASVKDDSTGT